MRKLVVFLVVWIVSASLVTRAYIIPRPISRGIMLYSSRGNASLGTMGSDVLIRPADENSPEFKDYLKNLLKLQVTRAKSGFSAPSSGTSDAYLAKLNRLKLEREALRKAGLADADIDMSYKPEDYEAALFESQEPLVANSPLTGDAAIAAKPGISKKKSGNKMRELTSEEIFAAKSAEEAVARALANGVIPTTATNNYEDDTHMSPDERLKRQLNMQGEDEDLLENLLQKPNIAIANDQNNVRSVKSGKQPNYIESLQKKIAEKGMDVQKPAPIVSSIRPVPASPAAINAQSARPVQPSPIESNVRPVPASPAAINTAQSTKSVQSSPVEGAKSVKPTSSDKFRALQPKFSSEAPDVTIPKPSPPAKKTVKLSIEDLELSAQTLQLLVKHRGGGPFGLGRLQGEEIKELYSRLGEIVVALETDSIQNSVDKKQINSPKATVVTAPRAPNLITDTEAVVVTQTVSKPTNYASPLPKAAPVQQPKVALVKSSVAASSQDDPRVDNDLAFSNQFEAKAVNVPIALGLDKFLQTPRALDIDELSALRDGLIQCLAIVQGEVSARAAAPINNIANDPTERQFTSSISNDIPVEKDVKTAIGLLLKHRGGPGFGHGRLQGKELEYLETKLNQVVGRLEAEI